MKTSGFKVLELMNGFIDSSITRIVMQILDGEGAHQENGFTWYVGGLCESAENAVAANGVATNAAVANAADTSQGERSSMTASNLMPEFKKRQVQLLDLSHCKNPSTLKTRLRDYILHNEINVVHSHTPRAILATSAALAGICSGQVEAAPTGAKRQIYHIATKHILQNPGDRRWGMIYTFLDRLSLYLPDWLVMVSDRDKQQVVRFPGVRAEKVMVIHNSIDCDYYFQPEKREFCRASWREAYGLSVDHIVIGCVGRVEKVKSIDLLLHTFQRVSGEYPQLRLMIIGKGSQEEKLRGLSRTLGIDQRVVWTGFRNDIPEQLAGIDIFIQASKNEGLSLSLLQAMAAQKAIIATDVGGTRELIRNGETGILIQPGSSDAFESALLDLITHPHVGQRTAVKAREFVNMNFDVYSMVRAYRDLYLDAFEDGC